MVTVHLELILVVILGPLSGLVETLDKLVVVVVVEGYGDHDDDAVAMAMACGDGGGGGEW